MLIMWKNVPQHIGPPELTLPHPKAVPHPRSRVYKKEVKHKVKDTNQEEPKSSDEEFNSAESDVEEGEVDFQHTHDPKADGTPAHQTASQLLDTLNKASVHMRRAILWKVYDDQDAELEASLYFSAPVDDGTVIYLRWLRTLVLHTLELLYYQAKWENLSHLALLFNTYTWKRYSHMVTPVLVHAQRRLLDRISCFGDPPAPQPHFTYTEMISGEKVTCRNYASRQLLFPCGGGQVKITDPEPKKLADVKKAMCLVCVPLDVEDTLQCLRETEEKTSHTADLLAQPNSTPAAIARHKALMKNIFKQISTTLSRYKHSMTLETLTALDCALQSSGVLESWDGDSWGSSSSQETLRYAGIWGCLQGALLSAKIAQHILTSNIDQRTKCCLLSGKLFKHPSQHSEINMPLCPIMITDLSYSTYSVETELIPGIDLFSEPDRRNLCTTVASLSFLCHWLYTSGHRLKVLHVLALYLCITGNVCRDRHLTVMCRILKVKVFTELGAFTQAFKELSSLTISREIPLPHAGHYRAEKPCWVKQPNQ
ncbi:hypothetical protein cypCar_00001732 [Cyprinus carpio]|nr:hypothetical protein cypCar_00001732 [Cyprinus carpio]